MNMRRRYAAAREAVQHAAKTARDKSEIPAEEIAGDDCGYAESPQMQYAGVAAEGAFFEVLVGGFRVDGQGLHSTGGDRSGTCPTKNGDELPSLYTRSRLPRLRSRNC